MKDFKKVTTHETEIYNLNSANKNGGTNDKNILVHDDQINLDEETSLKKNLKANLYRNY